MTHSTLYVMHFIYNPFSLFPMYRFYVVISRNVDEKVKIERKKGRFDSISHHFFSLFRLAKRTSIFYEGKLRDTRKERKNDVCPSNIIIISED